MLRFAYDKSAVALVVCAYGASTDDEVESYRQALAQLDQQATFTRVTPATIFIVSANAVRPDAKQRQALAEVWTTTHAPLHLFALVTSSAVDRGIMKVISWISPPGNRRRESVHATFDQAASWTCHERGQPIPQLSTLEARALGSSP
jgi:hypothetical protein